MEENLNIVKQTAKELGITQKELAERIGVSQGTLNNMASSGASEQVTKALELLLENHRLKKDVEVLYTLKDFMNRK